MIQNIQLETIRQSTRRLAYTADDQRAILSFLKKEQRHGLVVHYHPAMGSTKEALTSKIQDGIIILTCPQIETDFLCIVEDNGRGLFGGQKRRFRVYLGDAALDDFAPGPSFRLLNLALSSLNNIFRDKSLIKGPIF